MKVNCLRGNVADRPIDSHVMQDDYAANNTMQGITAMQPQIEQVPVRRRPNYDKG